MAIVYLWSPKLILHGYATGLQRRQRIILLLSNRQNRQMAHKRQVMLFILGPVARCHVTRLPGKDTRVTAHAVTKEVCLALLNIIPERIRRLEAQAIFDCAVKGRPLAEETVRAYVLDG